MSYKVDNAIIMAAGTASRFAPISYERPKALIEVKGEILIERQIRQLQEAGIKEIILVVGYKKEAFAYLKEKFNIKIIENNEYLTRNNNGTINVVRDYLKNSFICSSDNYFATNPFESEVDDAYYAAVYSEGHTEEWCLTTDDSGCITDVKIGGENSWYMLGHVFWTEDFSRKMLSILDEVYDLPETKDMLWEKIYMSHLDVLKLKIRKYSNEDIFEFDTLDELRIFDSSYINDTRSEILKAVAKELNCQEKDLVEIKAYKDKNNAAAGFNFIMNDVKYKYEYESKKLIKLDN